MIGVLTQPLNSVQSKDSRYENKTSYIMANYIYYLESAGARTVPLIFDGNLTAELAKVDKLNGIFYCGGSASSGPYEDFGKQIF